MENGEIGMNDNICTHGGDKEKPCWHCRDIYKQQDIDYYDDIFKQKGWNVFEVAFELAKRFNRWSELHKSKSIDKYLTELKETKRLRWERNTLKQAYYVTTSFEDLKIKDNRKLHFSHYREIATAKLSANQKREVRAEAESKAKITIKSLRKLIESKNKVTKEEKQAQIILSYSKQEQFINEIREFLSDHKWIEGGTDIVISSQRTITFHTEKQFIKDIEKLLPESKPNKSWIDSGSSISISVQRKHLDHS